MPFLCSEVVFPPHPPWQTLASSGQVSTQFLEVMEPLVPLAVWYFLYSIGVSHSCILFMPLFEVPWQHLYLCLDWIPRVHYNPESQQQMHARTLRSKWRVQWTMHCFTFCKQVSRVHEYKQKRLLYLPLLQRKTHYFDNCQEDCVLCNLGLNTLPDMFSLRILIVTLCGYLRSL